jgi:hypothetical protein
MVTHATTSPFHGPKGADGTRNLIDGQGFRPVRPDRSADPVSGGTNGAKIFDPLGASEVAQALYPSHSSRARRSPFLGSKMEGRAASGSGRQPEGVNVRTFSHPFAPCPYPGNGLFTGKTRPRGDSSFWVRSDAWLPLWTPPHTSTAARQPAAPIMAAAR